MKEQALEEVKFTCAHQGCTATTHKDVELLNRGWIAARLIGKWNGTMYRVLCPLHAKDYLINSTKQLSIWEEHKAYEKRLESKEHETTTLPSAPPVLQLVDACIDV